MMFNWVRLRRYTVAEKAVMQIEEDKRDLYTLDHQIEQLLFQRSLYLARAVRLKDLLNTHDQQPKQPVSLHKV